MESREKKEVSVTFQVLAYVAMGLVALELVGIGVASKVGTKIGNIFKKDTTTTK